MRIVAKVLDDKKVRFNLSPSFLKIDNFSFSKSDETVFRANFDKLKADIRLMKEELQGIERYRTPKERSLAQCSSNLEAMQTTRSGLESELHQVLVTNLIQALPLILSKAVVDGMSVWSLLRYLMESVITADGN